MRKRNPAGECGDRILADRLVLVLHVAYAFVPIGFLLMGAAVVWRAIFPISAGPGAGGN